MKPVEWATPRNVVHRWVPDGAGMKSLCGRFALHDELYPTLPTDKRCGKCFAYPPHHEGNAK